MKTILLGKTILRGGVLIGALALTGCDKQPADSAPTAATPAPTSTSATRSVPEIKPLIQKLVTLDGAQAVSAEMQMQVTEADGKRAQLEFTLQRKYEGEKIHTFIKVNAPKEESDKALLALEEAGKPTEAKSYLAGLKKLASLNSSSQVSFREAKVAVQELLGMELAQYDFSVAERVTEAGKELLQADGKAKPDTNLAFPRMRAYFEENTQQPVRFEFFNDKDQLQKRVLVQEIKTIQNHQVLTRLAIEEVLTKRNVQLHTRTINFNAKPGAQVFTEDNLKRVVTAASAKLL